MGLVLKYVEQTKSGSWQYRRRVPKAVASLILKREFKAKLGGSKKEALTAWPSVHARVEREIAAAEERLAISLALENGTASEREAYAEAQRRRTDLIAAGADEAELIYVDDSIADSYPQSHYTPLNASPVDYHTINLLRLGPDRHRPPPSRTLAMPCGYISKSALATLWMIGQRTWQGGSLTRPLGGMP